MTNKNCECVCHTIVPLKKGEAYPVQFDRPVSCVHCTRSNNMTPQEARNKRFDEKFPSLYDESDEFAGEIGFCVNKYVKSFIQSEVDLALVEERKKIIEMIDKFEAEPLLTTCSTNVPCICSFENGDIIELDENNRHKTCGKPLPLIVPMKTPAQKLKEFLTKDEDIAHLTSLKELIK